MYVSVNRPVMPLSSEPALELVDFAVPSARAGVTGGMEFAAVALGSGSSMDREGVVEKALEVITALCACWGQIVLNIL